MRGSRSAGSLVSSGRLSVCTLCIQCALIARPMTNSELRGSGMRCVVHCSTAAPPLPSREACSAALATFFVRSVMVCCAPSERFTMREPRTTSTILSECLEKVVRACAVELDEHVVDCHLPCLVNVSPLLLKGRDVGHIFSRVPSVPRLWVHSFSYIWAHLLMTEYDY